MLRLNTIVGLFIGLVLIGSPVRAETEVTARLAQAAVSLPEGSDRFAVVGAAIGDARIVFLGEPWHGDGRAMVERAELVRYLHEHHGFDVLVFEADFYALHHGWQDARDAGTASAMARDEVYPFWGGTPVMAPLWRYIDSRIGDERPLAVAGVDTKLVGLASRTRLSGELEERLAPMIGAEPAVVAAGTLQALLTPTADEPPVSDAAFRALQSAVGTLERSFREDAEADPFWRQMAQSIRRQLSGESRDPGMAANLIWLATELYPDSRIIVWAHNNHVVTDKWMLYDAEGPEMAAVFGDESVESRGRRTYLGEATRHYFGDRAVYSLALVSHAGRYSSDIAAALYGGAFDDGVTSELMPTEAGSLEAALHAGGHDVAFIDLRTFQGETAPVRTRVLDYSQLGALPMPIWRGFDGLIYLDATYGLQGREGSFVAP